MLSNVPILSALLSRPSIWNPRARRVGAQTRASIIAPRNKSSLFVSSGTNDDQSSKKQQPQSYPQPSIPDKNLLDTSRLYTERRPSRKLQSNSKSKGKSRKDNASDEVLLMSHRHRIMREWGVETIDDHSQKPPCPDCIDSVAHAAFHAISSTLYLKNYLDPNIVQNARATSISEKRPVGFASWPEGRDVGRLGIEIDGARHLLMETARRNSNPKRTSTRTNQSSITPPPRDDHDHDHDLSMFDFANLKTSRIGSSGNLESHIMAQEGRALRRLSLVLASQLSMKPWHELEDDCTENENHSSESRSRPIALFFSTIKQALLASKELQLLQKIERIKSREKRYENIRILCLGQDEIPKDMTHQGSLDSNGKRRSKWGSSKKLSDGVVDPTRGLVLVVKPTDFNNEVHPAFPLVGAVKELQILLTKASIALIPSVVISPRLTEQFDERGIEQSGYQRSSTYGGVEVSSNQIMNRSYSFNHLNSDIFIKPPKGPTPWILRDFIPPIYSWITYEFSKRPPSPLQNNSGFETEISYISRVAMTQSIMSQGHPWNIFVVESVYSSRGGSTLSSKESNYHFIAKTGTKAGRPSRQVILDIISEWA